MQVIDERGMIQHDRLGLEPHTHLAPTHGFPLTGWAAGGLGANPGAVLQTVLVTRPFHVPDMPEPLPPPALATLLELPRWVAGQARTS